jgi:hypothetical protein
MRACRRGHARRPIPAGSQRIAATLSIGASSSTTSWAVSTSLAPSRINWWQPLASGLWIEPGNREHLAPLFARQPRGDQRAAAEAGLDDQRSQRQPADDAVASRKVLSLRGCARRELADQRTLLHDARLPDRRGAPDRPDRGRCRAPLWSARRHPGRPDGRPRLSLRPDRWSPRIRAPRRWRQNRARWPVRPALPWRLPTTASCGSHKASTSPRTNSNSGAPLTLRSNGG